MGDNTEFKIEREVCDLVWTYLGIESIKLNTLSDSGYPDRLFWLPGGKPLMIEFKRPGFRPTPKQIHVHEKLRSLGYQVEVHDDVHTAFKAIIDAVEAAQVSKESREVLTRARMRCSLLRSRSRKNVDHLSGD